MMELELKDFVKQSLVQIVEGVVDAQKEADKLGAKVNPTGLYFYGKSNPGVRSTDDINIPQMIEFDVGVTVSGKKATEGKASVGIIIASLNLSTGGQSSSENTVVNRIKFQVPVLFPGQFIESEDTTPTVEVVVPSEL